MAHPKRRTSKARKRKRRSHLALNVPQLVNCAQCGQPKTPHRVCNECGYYNKEKQVLVNEES